MKDGGEKKHLALLLFLPLSVFPQSLDWIAI